MSYLGVHFKFSWFWYTRMKNVWTKKQKFTEQTYKRGREQQVWPSNWNRESISLWQVGIWEGRIKATPNCDTASVSIEKKNLVYYGESQHENKMAAPQLKSITNKAKAKTFCKGNDDHHHSSVKHNKSTKATFLWKKNNNSRHYSKIKTERHCHPDFPLCCAIQV